MCIGSYKKYAKSFEKNQYICNMQVVIQKNTLWGEGGSSMAQTLPPILDCSSKMEVRGCGDKNVNSVIFICFPHTL